MATNLCDSCGQSVAADASYCVHCGAELAAGADLTVKADPHELQEQGTAGWDSVVRSLREATEGRYEIEATLGQGGMGAVYRARDLVLDCPVAIKVMLPGVGLDADAVERFRQEARTIAGLRHPHIVTVHDLRQHGGLHFFVLDLIAGSSLDTIIKRAGNLPVPVIRLWLAQVASALEFAHRRGVIHRDIKPGNILIDAEGNAVLTDFGIAKLQVNPKWKTVTGGFLGTPHYASPEQWKGEPVTPASDQYSLGIVAYAMLTGSPPFDGDSIADLLMAHTNEAPKSVGILRPDCPQDLAKVVHRMLEKNPTARWPGLREIVSTLGAPPPPNDEVWSLARSLAAGKGIEATPESRTWVTPLPEPKARSITGTITHWFKPKRRRVAAGGAVALTIGILAVAWPASDETAAPSEEAAIAPPPADTLEAPPPVPSRTLAETEATPTENAPEDMTTAASAVRLTLSRTTLRVGDSVRPEVLLLGNDGRPLGATKAALTVTDTRVARVTPSGWIVGIGPGSTNLVARAASLEAREVFSVAAVAPPFRSVSAGGDHTCGIATDGSAYCWGRNDRGQVAAGLPETQPFPFPRGGRFAAVSAGGMITCALGQDQAVVCWGATSGPRGRYRSVTTGARHACGIMASGSAACWGANDRGQLGIGSTAANALGQVVEGEYAFDMIAAGAEHTCGLLGGRVYCWGSDVVGQTGTGTLERGMVTQPTEVEGDHGYLVFVTSGTNHTCALTRVGTALCWGANEYGQLGDGSKQPRHAPRPVRPPMGGSNTLAFEMVTAGTTHTCGLNKNQRVFCWGDNRFGQLGDGTTTGRVVPVQVRLTEPATSVSAGRAHTCAVLASTAVQCWGANGDGQLGDGTSEDRARPVTPGQVTG